MKNEQPSEPTGRPLAISLTVLAGVLTTVIRLIPHPANCSPMGAVGLFGGGRLKAWQALTLPLAVMLASDLGLWVLSGFDFKYSLGHISRVYVYGSVLGYALIGRWLLKGRESLPWTLAASVLGSVQFFLVTNFFDWLVQPMHYHHYPEYLHYSRDLAGLMQCYVAALPFYQGEVPLSLHAFVIEGDFRYSVFGLLLGDLVFTGGLYGLHAGLTRLAFPAERVPAAQPANG